MKKSYMLMIMSVLIAVCVLVQSCQQQRGEVKIGKAPPNFILKDLKNSNVRVPGDFKGKVVVIRFWADWCTYCAEEMPAIDAVYHRYKDKGLEIIAVNVGQPKDVVEAFVLNLKISYPVLLDTYSVTARQYGVVGLPTTFVLDRNGILREKILGEADITLFENTVVQLL